MSHNIARAAVCLTFEPSHALVKRIVQWVTDFCQMTLEDIEFASRIELAVHELVENLMKYGEGPSVNFEFEVYDVEGGTVLRLKTSNAAAPARMAEAVRILDGLRDAEDAVAYYDKLVLESAPREGVSGLGLARIRAEGDLDVDYEVHGDRLSISVLAEIPNALSK